MSALRHILITNDDGIDADALPPLSEALAKLGDVAVIVPERNWSGASHSITLFRPLRVRPTKLRSGQPAYMTDGSPTDCVRLAVLGFLKHRPDIVVSGINRGANMGDDITYSGTVAAAMEGLLSSIPSIAISIGAFGGDIDYGPAASFAALLARNILDRGFAAARSDRRGRGDPARQTHLSGSARRAARPLRQSLLLGRRPGRER